MNLSDQAQAVILLTVPFGKTEVKPLSVKEWGRFAIWLKGHQLEPSRLLKGEPRSLLSSWSDRTVTLQRIERLLDRGGALGFALEKWQRAGLWIVTRSEPDYPERWKRKLGLSCPPVLFGCGNRALLNKRGLAVVGSRDSEESDLEFAANLGRAAVAQGLSVISGGARGVDESAMLAALESHGTAIGVLADSLLRAATSRKYRKYLREANLVLLSPFNPEAGFSVGNAMVRNKYIYCLSEAAVVVNCTPEKGGTWNGAMENLKNDWVPLWVQRKEERGSGNATLVRMGARWLPPELGSLSTLWEMDPGADAAATKEGNPALQMKRVNLSRESVSTPLPVVAAEGEDGAVDLPSAPNAVATTEAGGSASDLIGDLYEAFLRCLRSLTEGGPMKANEIAERLQLEKAQVNALLRRGTKDGLIKKISKPTRYQASVQDKRQPSLFDISALAPGSHKKAS